MPFPDIMNTIRYLDNLTAKWLMRHFYFMFFQIVLVIAFVFWFINLFNVIDTSTAITDQNLSERLSNTQSINVTIITFLFLLNSFWMLFMFNAIQRIMSVLRDVSYHLSRMRVRSKDHS